MQLAKSILLSWLELSEIALGLVQCANFLTGPMQNEATELRVGIEGKIAFSQFSKADWGG
jgi:hypothetical protein